MWESGGLKTEALRAFYGSGVLVKGGGHSGMVSANGDRIWGTGQKSPAMGRPHT